MLLLIQNTFIYFRAVSFFYLPYWYRYYLRCDVTVEVLNSIIISSFHFKPDNKHFFYCMKSSVECKVKIHQLDNYLRYHGFKILGPQYFSFSHLLSFALLWIMFKCFPVLGFEICWCIKCVLIFKEPSKKRNNILRCIPTFRMTSS